MVCKLIVNIDSKSNKSFIQLNLLKDKIRTSYHYIPYL